MHRALLLVLAACNPVIDDGRPEADPDPEVEPDPRFDADTWPDSVGGDRPAVVVAPSDYDGSSLLPVIVMLHGYGGNADGQDRFVFQLSSRVDERDFVLIMPDGTVDARGSQFWNATDVCCDFFQTGVDDVGYLLGLLDEVEGSMPIDPDRITFVGHSNGGFMSYRMACEASDRIAGIASLAGANFKQPEDCGASEPVSALQIHGTADATISYSGNQFLPSARESVDYWADQARCDGPRNDGQFDYETALPGAETEKLRWTGCDGTDVQLWTMEMAGHIPSFTEQARDDLTQWLLAQRK